MFSEPVVYVDIETTGLSPAKAKIIEVGAIRVEGDIVSEFKTLINPGSFLPYYITNVTGITDADLVHAPYFDDVAYQLHSFLSGATFIAHNVRFDYSFIKHQLEACGYKFRPKLICTVRLSRALYPGVSGHSLEKIIKRHDIKVNSRHRAYDDAKAIKDFSEIAFQEHGVEAFGSAIKLQSKTQTMPPHLNHAEISKVKNTTGVYIYEDEQGLPLYVGKSKQLQTRLKSHFSNDLINSKEMKLSQKVHKIRTIETSSELEALLLESKMVKELLPVHNRQLRRQRELSVLRKFVNQAGYTCLKIETIKHLEPNMIDSIYGVYSTKGKARSALEVKLRTFSLCPKLVNLEKTSRACFLHSLGKCYGACVNLEPTDSYNNRLELAMQRSKLESWPYSGPITIKASRNSSLIVDQWMVVGKLSRTGNQVISLPSLFDMDTYRILRSFISKNLTSPLISLV
jgi:DNA polymerase-3 subunit epsilon